MNNSLCARESCAARPDPGGGGPAGGRRTAASGLRLCSGCCREARANLIELPGIYDDCAAALLPQRNPTLQRVSGSRQAPGILLDEHAVTTRASILCLLASWSALVADERTVTRPTRRQPAALAAFLLRHLSWLLAHPAAADFADEICQATRSRRADGPAVAVVGLGQCVHDGCDGAMTAATPASDRTGPCEVRCAAGHTWRPSQWLQLHRRIQQIRETDPQRRPETTA